MIEETFVKPDEKYSREPFVKAMFAVGGLEQIASGIRSGQVDPKAYREAGELLHDDSGFYTRANLHPTVTLNETEAAAAESQKHIRGYIATNFDELFGNVDEGGLVAYVNLVNLAETGDAKLDASIGKINAAKKQLKEIVEAQKSGTFREYLAKRFEGASGFRKKLLESHGNNQAYVIAVFNAYAKAADIDMKKALTKEVEQDGKPVRVHDTEMIREVIKASSAKVNEEEKNRYYDVLAELTYTREVEAIKAEEAAKKKTP